MAQPQTGLVGTVRRYNGSRGFGFIVGPGQFSDTMFSRNELPPDAKEIRGNIIENRQVNFEAQIMPDGRAKATSVTIPYSEGFKLTGIIKTYSEKNGYGFVESSSVPQDVFFKRDDFDGGVVGDIKGQLVLFEMGKAPDGKLRAEKMQFQTMKIAEKFKSGHGGGLDSATMGVMVQQLAAGGMDAHTMQTVIQQMMAISGGSMGSSHSPAPAQPHQLALPSAQTGVAPLSSGMTTGYVKSFSEQNGYGFISVPGLGQDVRFGQKDIPGGNIATGTEVQFSATQNGGRLQASMVIVSGSCGFGGGASKRPADNAMNSMQMQESATKHQRTGEIPVTTTGQMLQGTVKSYNPTKGWGLITSPSIPSGGNGQPGDVFFMKSNLPQESRQEQLTSRSVMFELVVTEEGKYRAQNIVLM